MAESDQSCYDLITAFQAKVPDDIPSSFAQLMQRRLNTSRATMLNARLQIIANLMASMELLHQLRQSAGTSMDPNVWFDDASIIHKAFNENVIDEDTRDTLLRLRRTYQQAKHRNEFSGEDDETRGFHMQMGTLKQAEGYSHVVVRADASNKSTKVGEVANGTTCSIQWQDDCAGAFKIHVETEHVRLIGWVRQENVCNIGPAGASDSDDPMHPESHLSNEVPKHKMSRQC